MLQHDDPMNPSTLKRVVLCADDYAMNESVSAGILHLARAQRLSATSAMVLSPRWSVDVAPLRELRGQLDVGLHLDWTSEFAQQAGHGRPLGSLMWQSMLGQLNAEVVRRAIEQQLDVFEKQWQAAPDHVDGHQHVQQFAGVRNILVDILQRRYGASGKRPWMRVSKVSQPGLKGHIISWMGAHALFAWASQNRWPVAMPLSGVYAFDGDLAQYDAHMQSWLAHLPKSDPSQPVSIIMCHPAATLQADDPIGAARVREYTYFKSSNFEAHLETFGVQLSRGNPACQ